MDNDKHSEFEEAQEADRPNESAPRARNRTVMLTPDITGEVRARLAQELGQSASTPTARSGVFENAGSSYRPAAEANARGFLAPQANATPAHTFVAPAVRPKGECAVWTQEAPLVGFLVSFDQNQNGTVYELRTGRIIVTSEAPSGGNYILVSDSTVSPQHAIMRISQNGEIQVLDQLSEFGTRVQRFGSEEEQELSGEKTSLDHGDIIKFGNRKFHVCVIARGTQG